MAELTIRRATEADLPAIHEIYNYYVLNSTATYQLEVEPLETRIEWFRKRGPKHPVFVAEIDCEVVGWASISPFHSRCAFASTVENSVYIHHERHRLGIGRALMEETIRFARAAGFHTIIAGISADQEASLRLHEKLGFVEVGRLRQVGNKFERWLDVAYLQLMLGE